MFKKETWVTSMILLIDLLKNIIIVFVLKTNNRLIRQEKVIKNSVDLSDMPPLEGDEEEVKEGIGLKISTPNKLLNRLPILLAQIKAGNNSCKLKNEIFCINTTKSLKNSTIY